MQNFQFCIPTNILFGKGQMEHLPEIVGAYGKNVLLTYGGSSMKKTGLYDKIKELLSGWEIYEVSGIASNPLIDSV